MTFVRRLISIFTILIGSSQAYAQEFLQLDKPASGFLVENFGSPSGAAPGGAARPMPVVALDLIKGFEGWIPAAYNDPAGYCTIGYGHLIALERCENLELGKFAAPLTQVQGSALLEKDTISARNFVSDQVEVDLNDEQFGALVSFVFNIGGTNFRKSTLRRLLNEGDYLGAADQFPRWVRADGQVLTGLVYRRGCERALFLGEPVTDNSGNFDRRTCVSSGAAPLQGATIDVEVGE